MCLCKLTIDLIFISHTIRKFKKKQQIWAAIYLSLANFKIKNFRKRYQHCSLLLMKMIVCFSFKIWCRTFSFICGSLHVGLLKRSSATHLQQVISLAMHVAVGCHIWLPELVMPSHVYIFTICGFKKQMHLHISTFIWNASQTTT